MTTVLIIQAHPHIEHSLSLAVGEFIQAYRQSHPNDQLVVRDLYAGDGVPPLNDLAMEAWRKQKFEEPMSAEEEAIIKRHNTWLEEFVQADKYIFINPMYNHFLPAELKQYLDLTAVAHRTFKYTHNGSVGLLHNKKAIHIQAAGGVHHAPGANFKFLLKKALHAKNPGNAPLTDLGDLYLTQMLKFYGVTDIQHLFIEGADEHRQDREAILQAALQQARQLAPEF
jgi:FMN-dependent NADH-azoreductase